jgi:hypothetical protein
MNENELQEIKRRAEAATPGPWEPQEGTKYLAMGGMGLGQEKEYFVMRDGDDVAVCCDCSTPDGVASPENALFIANARQDVPALVAEVERLRAALEAICSVWALDQEGDYEDLCINIYGIASKELGK